jgi:TatD DNase family protein
MAPLIDAMAHLDDPRLVDPEGLMARAHAAGIQHVVNAGYDPLEQRVLPVAEERLPFQLHRAFGLHPLAINDMTSTKQMAALSDRLQTPNVVALGECGLDARSRLTPLDRQEAILLEQLHLARKNNLPVILHCVKAWGRLLELLRKAPPLPRGGMLHSYGGSAEMVADFAALGLHFSFGGALTHAQGKKAQTAAKAIPMDRLVVESDCPDHPPQGTESSQSEPGHLPHVIEAVAALKGQKPESVARATFANAKALFGI